MSKPKQDVTPNPTNFAPNHKNKGDEKIPGRQEDLPIPSDTAKPSKRKGSSPPPLPADQDIPATPK